jgi:multifunctional beta-oxidation protein
MTETVMSVAELEGLRPKKIVPIVAVLCHPSSRETGGIFEAAGGVFSKLRWQRAKGALLKPDPQSLTPGAILENWDHVNDFSEAEYPSQPPDFLKVLGNSQKLSNPATGKSISFQGKIAIVTGAGGG